ncbi:hypothetical protein CKJ89_10185 [Klebsiella pneumoniae]|nr:hypothetical protein CKJ89_10185 [Klebsiella pneumoniae]
MDNGSGETVQDAQRGQNRQAEPGGEYFVYFWTGRAATASFAVALVDKISVFSGCDAYRWLPPQR